MSVNPQFFRDLFSASAEFIDAAPITIAPPRMAYITDVLEPAVLRQRPAFRAPALTQGAGVPPADEAQVVGLNTIGMLLDRFSILAIKRWNLLRRRNSPELAGRLVDTQVEELSLALANARPGHSSLNNKMTNRDVEASVSGFEAAYASLLSTNLILWEAQEILYNHDISVLPCEELRAYIDFFSRGNLQRNVFIETADAEYWRERRG